MLALAVSTQGALVIRGVFAVRHDYVAEHLCVNRHNPDVKCDGMCFLKDRMEAHDRHDEKGETPQAVLTAPTLFAVAAPEAEVPPNRWREVLEPGVRPDLGKSAGAGDDVFHPPRVGETGPASRPAPHLGA